MSTEYEWLRLTQALFELARQLRPFISAVMHERFLLAVLADAARFAAAFRDYLANVRVTVLDPAPPLPAPSSEPSWRDSDPSRASWRSDGTWWLVHEGPQSAPSSAPFYIARSELKPAWDAKALSAQEAKAKAAAIQAARSRPGFASLDKAAQTEAIRDADKKSKAAALAQIEAASGYVTVSARTATAAHVIPSPARSDKQDGDCVYNDKDCVHRLWAELVLQRHAKGA